MEELKDVILLKERLWNLASDDNISVFEIETFLRTFLKRKPLPTTEISFQNYCRCSLNHKGEIFTSVERCSYNPNIKSIGLQRCNYVEQQVFYASVPLQSGVKCHGTAILEVSIEHISSIFKEYYFLTLSRWITTRKLSAFYFPDLQMGGAISDRPNFDKLLYEHPDIDAADIPYFLSIFKFFSDIFSIKKDKKTWYRISSAFYNCIMRFGKDENKSIDGMIYSSSNSDKTGTNIVLNKELIDNETIYCDYVQMWIAQRNPSNPNDIWFEPASEGVFPMSDKTFEIKLYPKYIKHF